jgi:Gas vesicle synthesis protein GvpL/GvpF
VIYAYVICEPATAAASSRRRGLGGARLRALKSDGVAAVYSRHRSLNRRATPELIMAHERVVEAIMAEGPVLPLRFGTQPPDEERLAAVLADRRDNLLDGLDRVRGQLELALRVLRDPQGEHGKPAGNRSGRDYLLARVGEHRRAELVSRELHTPLAALANASVLRDHPRPPAILVAAYLVDAGRVPEFRRRADELAAHQENLQIVVTGPLPPYTFAAEERDEG